MKFASTVSVVALLAASLAAQASTVTGDVVNKTINKPAVGDKVVLIDLQGGMQDIAQTTTDARGHFSINVPDGSAHLIRVEHQKADYFAAVPPGTTHVNVTVYDVAAKVPGVSTEADVMRVESGPQGLQVVQNYFVQNASKPPRTQFSAHAFDVYLPPGAQISGAAAMGPGGMPVSSSPMPQGNGLYSFVFPLRPGETRFQLSYTVPYSGSLKLTPRVSMPTANLAVMLPKSMSFQGPSAFQPANVDDTAQTFLAKNVQPSQALAFTVSGSGQMPRDSGQSDANSQGSNGGGQASAAADDRPGGGLGNPIDTPDPLQKYKYWILTALALLLVVAAAFFLRGKPAAVVAGVPGTLPGALPGGLPGKPGSAASGGQSGSLMTGLKEELFALETERLEGKLSDAEYAEQKAALEQVLKRALSRKKES